MRVREKGRPGKIQCLHCCYTGYASTKTFEDTALGTSLEWSQGGTTPWCTPQVEKGGGFLPVLSGSKPDSPPERSIASKSESSGVTLTDGCQ